LKHKSVNEIHTSHGFGRFHYFILNYSYFFVVDLIFFVLNLNLYMYI